VNPRGKFSSDEFHAIMRSQVLYYTKRKLQRSISEAESQHEFATMASLKVLGCEMEALQANNDQLAAQFSKMEAGLTNLARLIQKPTKPNKTATRPKEAAPEINDINDINDPQLFSPAASPDDNHAGATASSRVFKKFAKPPSTITKLETSTARAAGDASGIRRVDVIDTLTTPRRLPPTPRRQALPFRAEWKPKITPRVDVEHLQTASPAACEEEGRGVGSGENLGQAGAKCSPIAEGGEGSSVADGFSIAQDLPTNAQAHSPLGQAWNLISRGTPSNLLGNSSAPFAALFPMQQQQQQSSPLAPKPAPVSLKPEGP